MKKKGSERLIWVKDGICSHENEKFLRFSIPALSVYERLINVVWLLFFSRLWFFCNDDVVEHLRSLLKFESNQGKIYFRSLSFSESVNEEE